LAGGRLAAAGLAVRRLGSGRDGAASGLARSVVAVVVPASVSPALALSAAAALRSRARVLALRSARALATAMPLRFS